MPLPDAATLRALLAAESEVSAIRAQGAGGQNVNKVSNAVHLRFDVRASSLPDAIKERLLARSDQRLNDDGVVVIKAQTSRSREANLADAVERLAAMVTAAAVVLPVRKPTRPTRGSQRRRMDEKRQRGEVKAGRARPRDGGG